MILCTECYIQKNGKTLMLYRNKKENDINKNKWIGFGGKFEPGESPEQCLLREIKEETGVTLTEYRLRGFVTFNFTDGASEPIYMFLYTATEFTGEIGVCSEGTQQWIDNDKIHELDLWEGDRLFWKWMSESDKLFSALFVYNGNKLQEHHCAFY